MGDMARDQGDRGGCCCSMVEFEPLRYTIDTMDAALPRWRVRATGRLDPSEAFDLGRWADLLHRLSTLTGDPKPSGGFSTKTATDSNRPPNTRLHAQFDVVATNETEAVDRGLKIFADAAYDLKIPLAETSCVIWT